MVFGVSRSRFSALPPIAEPLRVITFNDPDDAEEDARLRERTVRQGYTDALASTLNELHARERAERQVRTFLEMVVLGTTSQLANFLGAARYIGPLRTIPQRGFLYERTGRVTSWANGLAAWELLLSDQGSLVDRTNQWLKRLEAGCQVVVQQLLDPSADAEQVSESHVDRVVRRLLLDAGATSLVLPSEVGAGISQIVPVVVGALQDAAGLCMVEQPEIHVHPALQVGLGDLFIEALSAGRRTILIETHSEHLLLRLLRRIRETTEKEVETGVPSFGPEKLSVLYVEGDPGGVQIRRLRVNEQGEFDDRWPRGFFAERMKELL
jgi:hypothetical protein